MIPDLPPTVSDEDRLDFYSTLVGNLTDQSTIHINWHTHRQNPSTCWICDMCILMSKILQITQTKYTKSSLDIETESSSENVSDSEIENDLNHDDEVTPEYDVVPDSEEQE